LSLENGPTFAVHLCFHGDLTFFLKPPSPSTRTKQLREPSSVKDVFESFGVPHPEVDLILVNRVPVGFDFRVCESVEVDLYPVGYANQGFAKDRLQALGIEKFVADGHLGKLTRNLRLLGVDVAYDPAADDRQLLQIATTQNRALLTRDRRLLMHAIVRHGYYLRSQNPLEQTVEVVRRFDLEHTLAPFTRCILCNAALERVEKSAVIQQLEPLTKVYYQEFRRCTGCGQIYWAGSHFDKLQTRIKSIRAKLPAQSGRET
jgi:uncharacterized protein with PIN domain